MTAGQFLLDELIDGVQREVRYRERVYGRLVSEGRMKQPTADYQLALMSAVLAYLEAQRPPKPEQGALL